MPLVAGLTNRFIQLYGIEALTGSEGVEGPIIVSSSNVDTIKYDPKYRLLFITFLKSGEYVYYDVPRDIWEALKDAPSKGKFVHAFIKDKYQYDRT